MIHITDKSSCCGCNACGDVCPKQAISFVTDVEGFWYPEVNTQKCIECGLCDKVCPFINSNNPKEPLAVYAAKNPVEEERRNSSSGGIFWMLVKQVLDEKGVVFGAAFDTNWMVCHSSAESLEDAKIFMGSKYVQSRVCGTYNKVREELKNGKKVLFTGTACQVAALKNFLKRDYDNLITVDVVCHGVPSPGVWKEYLKSLLRPEGAVAGENTVLMSLKEVPSIEGISFRDKQNGWRKFGFLVRYSADQREAEKFGFSSVKTLETREPFSSNVFMQGFLRNLYLRPSCYKCRLKSGRCNSDISLGDFWGVWNELPDMDDDRGVSLVMVNSTKGEYYLSKINPIITQIEYEQGLKYNPCITESVENTKWRDIFWKDFLNSNDFNAVSRTLKKMQPTIIKRILNRIKGYIISTFRQD